ncbi:cyclopropane-fatty-acyl-phospholipid synthase family protein [Methylophaga thalassica]|uniref:SAM-dependent methyltransferase n=1 Tax=Methylophaga thalassica TaxID=40223 RepID=UPI002E7AE391|nr:cyclopropane-fatty-acyl-phospholipid synthase family protein [Methylophaga thalassica]WVI86469.1 cyclopropane-fatty-acyl-phospholipid synthase family protein [Methylophaga thalassica]
MGMIDLAEKKWFPDSLIRIGIRQLLKQRLKDEYAFEPDKLSQRKQHCIEQLKRSPIAIETQAANEQHYEVPAEFYKEVLGKRFKYSGCYWTNSCLTLDDAEEAMLDIYLQRAELKNGQQILELGCGWGSLTIYMAEKLPFAKITAVSNSHSQRKYIEKQLHERGLSNVQVITCDVNELELDQQYDRVVSVEMFEHMRNYQRLFDKIAHWLKPQGKLFVHIFCHREVVYPFETEGDDNWMGRYFFTGGLMPSADTLLYFQSELSIEQQWLINGSHYQKTAEAWLENTDKNEANVLRLFQQVYGDEADTWLQRWRLFFMACAELFGFDNGNQWLVGHYLFVKK